MKPLDLNGKPVVWHLYPRTWHPGRAITATDLCGNCHLTYAQIMRGADPYILTHTHPTCQPPAPPKERAEQMPDLHQSPFPPFQGHSDTSLEAAASVAKKTPRLRTMVFNCLENQRMGLGLTDEQLVERMGLPCDTVRPRRVELVREGKVVDTGLRRKNRSGRNAVVWGVV